MSSGGPALAQCPICDGEHLVYQFTHGTTPIVRCGRCGLVMRNPQPSDAELAAIYNEQYFLVPERGRADRLKRGTAAGYLDEIEARLGEPRPANGARLRLLELGSGLGNLLVEARDARLRRDRRRVLGELGARRERAARSRRACCRARSTRVDLPAEHVRRGGAGRRHRAHARSARRSRATSGACFGPAARSSSRCRASTAGRRG